MGYSWFLKSEDTGLLKPLGSSCFLTQTCLHWTLDIGHSRGFLCLHMDHVQSSIPHWSPHSTEENMVPRNEENEVKGKQSEAESRTHSVRYWANCKVCSTIVDTYSSCVQNYNTVSPPQWFSFPGAHFYEFYYTEIVTNITSNITITIFTVVLNNWDHSYTLIN